MEANVEYLFVLVLVLVVSLPCRSHRPARLLIYQESLRRDSDIVVGSHLESVCNSIETDQETIEYIEVSKFIR